MLEYVGVVIDDPKTRRQLAQQGRLWLLSLVCATIATLVLTQTGSLRTAIVVFLGCVVVLGPLLWLYERRKRR
jgi:Flp pilus assembly protein TadB